MGLPRARRRGGGAFRERLEGYETDALTDRLIADLRRRGAARAQGKGGPFFAVLSVQPPHDPYVAPAAFMARHNPALKRMRPNVPDVPSVMPRARREFAGACAMIENLDWNVGRVRQALVETGLSADTHIVFFSDHGDNHGSHGQFRKTSPREESVRIPLIIGGDAAYRTQRGRRDVVPNHVDLAPTTLGLFGFDPPAWMAGFDYSGWYRRDRPRPTPPDSAYLQIVVPTGHGDSVDRPWRGIVTRDGWKSVCLEGQPWLMFNLSEDPYELANLAHNSSHGRERKRLHARLAQWVADTGDTFALPAV